jgi:hypothetical protein
MNDYKVYINLSSGELLNSINLGKMSEGKIVLKAPDDIEFSNKCNVRYNGLTLNCHILSYESVGIVTPTNDLVELCTDAISPKLGDPINPIQGYNDPLTLGIELSKQKLIHIPKGTPIFSIKFVTREYFELLKSNKFNTPKGVTSIIPKLEVYSNNKLKTNITLSGVEG